MTPRVSVVVPTRDRLATLQRALAAVDAQTFRGFEIIVIDDGSSDGTRQWLLAAGVRTETSAVPGGAGAARNLGIAAARGDLIAFLDDDDTWQPTYLEEQVRHLDANPNAAVSYADHVEVDPHGHVTRPDTQPILPYASTLVRMFAESFIHTMSVVVCRRRVVDTMGAFDEQLRVVQDLEWYARLLASGEQFIHLPRTLVARAMPGGLVLRHRQWHAEEGGVIDAFGARGALSADDLTLVRAYRSVFFSHLALTRHDAPFSAARLLDALRVSPSWTLRIAVRRLVRRFQRAHHAVGWDISNPAIT